MGPIAGAALPGYRQLEADAWTNDHGDLVSVHRFDTPPDIPAPLEELPRLRHALAHYTAGAGGGLIEADVLHLSTVPTLRQVLKVPLPGRPTGQAFLGSYTLPRASCSAVVKVQALEQGATGTREARVLVELGPERYFMQHPYAPDLRQGLPFHWADAPLSTRTSRSTPSPGSGTRWPNSPSPSRSPRTSRPCRPSRGLPPPLAEGGERRGDRRRQEGASGRPSPGEGRAARHRGHSAPHTAHLAARGGTVGAPV